LRSFTEEHHIMLQPTIASVASPTLAQRLGDPLRLGIAVALAAIILLLGVLARPQPPSLSTNVTGDPALAAQVLPHLAGALDRVSIATIDGTTVTYAHFGADDTTEYEIGSITKTFTSLLLADAIARGEVTADTKVGVLLPLGGSPAADVTLAELASHHSGLPRGAPPTIKENLLFLTRRDPYVQDVDEVIAWARAATLRNRGSYRYSNLGTALLGQALASASSLDYARLVQERIFRPLGMTMSSVPVTAENLPDDALTGYDASGKHVAPWTMNGAAPGGGIRSTSADMVRYAQALLDGSAPGMAALTPRWDGGNGSRVGYAWNTAEVAGRTVTSHNGATDGFCSAIAIDRANQRAVIIMSNTKVPVEEAALTLLVGDH
jgi:CubicO group peptidase (beta-lactamase class C family)